MTDMWIVTVQVMIEQDGWKRTWGLPTFFLSEDVQGFSDEEGCRRVARNVIGADRYTEVYITGRKL